MARRKVSNPLALAVLALLAERPMHPYEMSSTLRYRAKETSIKLNYGSLYSVVQSLQRHELIEVHEVVREGNRPERTVYGITERGQLELINWMSELISTPAKEYPQFEAALSLMPVLPPDEVVRLLRTRLVRLELEQAGSESMMVRMREAGLPELLAVE